MVYVELTVLPDNKQHRRIHSEIRFYCFKTVMSHRIWSFARLLFVETQESKDDSDGWLAKEMSGLVQLSSCTSMLDIHALHR